MPEIIQEQPPLPAAPPDRSFKKPAIAAILAALVAVALLGYYFLFSKGGSPASPQAGNGGAQNAPAALQAAEKKRACADSDAGEGKDAIYAKGFVTFTDEKSNQTVFNDRCIESNKYLEEYICYESPPLSGNFVDGRTVVKCPKGCRDGACIK